MLAVTAPADAVAPLLATDGELVVANRNAPAQTVLSGSRAAIERALGWCKVHDLSAQRLPVACAFHSDYVAPAQRRLAELLAELPISAPRIPVFSNTTGAPYPAEPAAVAAQLAEHLVRPVDFVAEVEAMYATGARLFVEAGPRGVLSGLVGRILGDRPHVCVPVDRPGRPGLVQLLDGLAALAAEGVPVDVRRLHRGRAVPAAPGQLSRSTWMVNAARAWPAGEPKTDAPAPVRVTVADERAPERPTEQQRMVPVIPSSAPSTNGHGNGARAVHPPPEAAVLLPDAPAADRAAHVMARYQDVMQQFLDTERSVMLTYLTGRAAPDLPTGRGGAAPTPVAAARPPAALPAAAAPPEPPLPAPTPSAEPVVVAPAPEPAAPAAPHRNGGATLTRDELTARLLAIVSDRTGYPSDMLSLDADLEADLSIDSIKRVEIAGTLMESLPDVDPTAIDAEQMTASRTLREVVNVLEPLLSATASASEEAPRPFR
jgi:acyl transferase domain-containing protein